MQSRSIGHRHWPTFPANPGHEWRLAEQGRQRQRRQPERDTYAWFGQWDYGFGIAWEIDFWGRYRRAIEASEDTLNANVEEYDGILVTLIGDVATAYVQTRTIQQQIAYARQTLALQKESLTIAKAKFNGGQTSQVDVNQGQSDVSNTESLLNKI